MMREQTPQAPPCAMCKLPNTGHRQWTEGDCVYMVCRLCSFFRYGRPRDQYVRHAKRVAKNRLNPRVAPHADYKIDLKKFNRRRDAMRRRTKDKCNPGGTMTQRELYTFVSQHPCHYCGGKATGLDRQSWDTCYEKKNLSDPTKLVACCTMCNASKRHYAQKTFVDKMNRVARQNT